MKAEQIKEALEAEAGADRMAAGLSCIPDPIKGDLLVVNQLRAELAASREWERRLREALHWAGARFLKISQAYERRVVAEALAETEGK